MRQAFAVMFWAGRLSTVGAPLGVVSTIWIPWRPKLLLPRSVWTVRLEPLSPEYRA